MEEDRMPKKIFTQELEGTRSRGRPRKRWKEEVERDLQVLGVRRWRELVAGRRKWKYIVRQAKAHSGLQCQWKKKKIIIIIIIIIIRDLTVIRKRKCGGPLANGIPGCCDHPSAHLVRMTAVPLYLLTHRTFGL
jgi:hypothetical protein